MVGWWIVLAGGWSWKLGRQIGGVDRGWSLQVGRVSHCCTRSNGLHCVIKHVVGQWCPDHRHSGWSQRGDAGGDGS